MDVNTLPTKARGWLVPGDPASLAVVLSEPVPDTLLNIADQLSVAGELDETVTTGQCWRWRLSALQVVTAVGDMAAAVNHYGLPFRVTTGTDDAADPLVAGTLNLVDKWQSSDQVALNVAVLIGPAGAGADADTIATLVQDYLTDNPPDATALNAHIASARPHQAAESGKDFAGWFNAATV